MPKSPEKCEEIRQQTRKRILRKSVLYFARNGLAGTKISDLARYIGIGQGTMYQYFSSKEELFQEIHKIAAQENEIRMMKAMLKLPLSAEKKVTRLSEYLLKQLREDANFAAMIALNTSMLLEGNADASMRSTTYQTELYGCMSKLILQGQKEGSIVAGNPVKLADYYWGVIYLYAMKRLFTTDYEMIDVHDLNRTLLICR